MTEPLPDPLDEAVAQQIAADYRASPEATEQLVATLLASAGVAAPALDWPFGSGTAEDPFRSPPGFSLDWTPDEIEAAVEAARPKGRA